MTILKEIELTFSKSSFVLSLNKNEKGNLFVEIEQTNSTFETSQNLNSIRMHHWQSLKY